MKKIRVFSLLAVWLTAAFASSLWAEPALSARVSSSEIEITEPVLLYLEVEWAQSEGQYAFMLPPLTVENLRLKRQGESQESFQRGSENASRKTFVFEYTPEKPGLARIESFYLQYVESSTGTPGSLNVPAFEIRVLKPGPSSKVILAAAALGVLVLLLLVFLVRRRSAKKKKIPSVPDPESRVAQALRQLPAISSESESLEKGRVVFRSYLAEKFELSQSISEAETLGKLEAKGLEVSEVRKAGQILEKFREASYSGVAISPAEVQQILEETARWVDRRRIVGANKVSD